MLIKLRFISLLFILLLSSSTFGQDYRSMSLNELHEDLTYWHNVVDQDDWWFTINAPKVNKDPGSNLFGSRQYDSPRFMPRKEAINQLIKVLKHLGQYNRHTYDNEIATMLRYSDKIKVWHRNNTIPTIEDAIRNHPDNPHNLASISEPIEYNNELDLPELGVQCPKSNPGNKLKNKFDNNNNTYVLCNYFNDGVLQYQMPYVNGKKEGIYLLFKGKHFNTRVPHPLADLKPYRNGKIHGVGEVWLVDKQNGQHWQLYKSDYTNGQKHGEQIKYYQNGTLHTVSMFNYGKITTSCSYRKDGSLVSCKQY